MKPLPDELSNFLDALSEEEERIDKLWMYAVQNDVEPYRSILLNGQLNRLEFCRRLILGYAETGNVRIPE